MAELVVNPYPVFKDIDGTALEDGFIFIGVAGQDPEDFPQDAFWDLALTDPATNIRTKSGYPFNSTFPGTLYTADPFSIKVKNKREEIIYAVKDSFISGITDADTLTGIAPGNASGEIPISNGTVNTNLNSDMVDGLHANDSDITDDDTTLTTKNKVKTYVDSFVNDLPVTYDISTADTVVNLAALTGSGAIKSYDWHSGDGSNTFKVVPDGAEKLRFDDGSEVSELEGKGNGSMSVQDVGTHWKVVSYDDSSSVSDSGSDVKRSWVKTKDGSKNVRGEYSASTAISTAYLGGFRSGGLTANIGTDFIDTNYLPFGSTETTNSFGVTIVVASTSTVTAVLTAVSSQGSVSRLFRYNLLGQWR